MDFALRVGRCCPASLMETNITVGALSCWKSSREKWRNSNPSRVRREVLKASADVPRRSMYVRRLHMLVFALILPCRVHLLLAGKSGYTNAEGALYSKSIHGAWGDGRRTRVMERLIPEGLP